MRNFKRELNDKELQYFTDMSIGARYQEIHSEFIKGTRLKLRKSETPTVQFIHESVRDFFYSIITG